MDNHKYLQKSVPKTFLLVICFSARGNKVIGSELGGGPLCTVQPARGVLGMQGVGAN